MGQFCFTRLEYAGHVLFGEKFNIFKTGQSLKVIWTCSDKLDCREFLLTFSKMNLQILEDVNIMCSMKFQTLVSRDNNRVKICMCDGSGQLFCGSWRLILWIMAVVDYGEQLFARYYQGATIASQNCNLLLGILKFHDVFFQIEFCL